MKLTEYRTLTAGVCGADPEGWEPDNNERQARMVGDMMIERGYGVRDFKFEYDDTVHWVTVELINIRRGHIFPGDGYT